MSAPSEYCPELTKKVQSSPSDPGSSITSNLGEVKEFEFDSVGSALYFLQDEDIKAKFITSGSLSLFDQPPAMDGADYE